MPDIAGNTLGTATPLQLTSSVQTFPDTVTPTANDYYRFNLSNRSSFNLSLTDLNADANVALLDSAGNLLSINGALQNSTNLGTFAELINTTLEAGTYYIQVSPGGSATSTDYTLNVAIGNNLSSDILWRNYATGQDLVWLMNGVSLRATASIPTVAKSTWKIQGAGDFNQDGQTDILWRDYSSGSDLIWLMNGTTFSTTISIPSVANSNWQIQGVGDFNGDFKADIVWRNYANGQNLVWLMNGTTFSTNISIPSVANSNWQIQGTGDFNGDSKADIVWRNYANGQNLVWLMNGTTFSTNISIPSVANSNWQIQGTGDFNKDNKTDLLWRNISTGDNVIWLMNGLTFSTIVSLPKVSDTNWRARSPFITTGTPAAIDVAGNTLTDAFKIGSNLSGSGTYHDSAGGTDATDYYRFTLGTASNVNLALAGLAANLDLRLLSSNGTVLQSSTLGSTTSESISSTLSAGTYYIQVYPATGSSSTYALNLAINNLPVLVTNTNLAVTEGAAATLNNSILRVTDNDNPPAQLTYTLGTLPTKGNLLLNGATLSTGATFTQADIDSGNKLSYQHDGSETLTDVFSFTVSDGAGGSLSTNTLDITVTPANDAPVITLPIGNLSADQGANSAVSGITIADPDANSSSVTVTLSAANGVLSLGLKTGLTFSQGTGSQDATMIFSGNLNDINTALTSLIYRSNATFKGIDTLSVSVNDNGNTGVGGPLSDSESLDITVTPINKPPIITLPSSQVASEDTSLTISGISIGDADGNGGNVTVSLSAVNGVVSLSSISGITLLTGTGSQDKNVTFTGTLASVNAVLNNLVYLGSKDFNGADAIAIEVNDSVSTGNGGIPLSDTQTLAITVNPVNDAPVLTVPGTQSANENTNLRITGISLNDVDAGNSNVTVNVSAGNGTLSFTSTAGLAFTSGNGNQNTSMIFSGTLAAVNSALNALIYRGNSNFNGTDTITISANDNGNTGAGIALSDSKAIAVNVLGVNNAPVITVPLAPAANSGTNLAIVGVSINDPDVGSGLMKVTIAAANGVLSIPTTGLTLSQGNGNQNSRITFEGTLAAINSALANLVYRSFIGFTGFETITISANDEGNSGIGSALSDTKTLFVNVGGATNNPPSANNNTYSILRNGTLTVPGTGVLGNDVDTDSSSLSANLVNLPTQGTLSFSSTGSFTYTPNTNFIGTDTFTYRASDGIANSNLATVTIAVTAPINNAPVANQDSFSFNEDAPYSNNVLLNDTDVEDTRPQTAQLISGPGQALNFSLNPDGSFNYTPTANFNGIDRFTYLAKDSAGSSSGTATVNLTVNAVNDAPIANPDSFSLNEDTPFSNNVLSNDTDVEDTHPQTASVVSGPGHALSFSLNSDGSFNYTPTANFNGSDSFTYIAQDSAGATSGTATVSLSINPVNDLPVAVNDSFSVSAGSTLNNSVLTNDTDVEDTRPQTASVVSGPTNAQSFTLNPNGTFTYVPNTGATTDSFTYIAQDSAGGTSNTATVNISVSSLPNNPPVANLDSFSLNEDTPFSNNVLSNDTDVEDARPQTASVVSGPGHALSFSLNSDGSFNYTPAANFNGNDSFTYIAQDSAGATSGTATVSLSINPINDLPVAVNDSFSVSAGSTLNNSVLTNDTDVEDTRPQTASVVSGPTNAQSFTLNPNGTFTYVPNTGATTDSFTYIAQDSAGGTSNTATVNISVSSLPNNPPVANLDSFSLNEDTPFSNNVLSNDTDVEDARPQTASVVSGPGHALSFSLNSDGSFNYTPAANFNGSDTFTYIAQDSAGATSGTATVNLTINPVNDLPIANPDSFSLNEDTPFNGNVLTNDTDVEDTQLQTAQIVSGPGHALSFTLSADGSFDYTPAADFNGTDTFTYIARDSAGADSGLGTVTLSIAPVNDAPIANPEEYRVVTNVPLSVNAANGVLANDTDVDGSSPTPTAVAGTITTTQGGTVTLNADGSFTYNPTTTFNGTDTFTYQATDGSLSSNFATVTLSVGPDVAPVAVDDSDSRYRTAPNTTLDIPGVFGVLGNDTDSDGPTLSAVAGVTTTANNGTVTMNADGSFLYTPKSGFTGTDTFIYQATDSLLTSNPATVTVVVATNALPVAVDDNNSAYRTTPGSALNIDAIDGVLQNDNDGGDGPTLSAVAAVTTTTNNGTVTLNADGSFFYTPQSGFTGTDTFTYQATDGIDTSTPATVTIAVSTNIPPIAQNDTGYRAIAGSTFSANGAANVLNNDSDGGDGPALSAVAGVTTTAHNGTVTMSGDGSFIYTPQAGFTGTDTFTYQATDGIDTSSAATVTINVVTNSAPIVGNDSYVATVNRTLTVPASGISGVLANDTDADGNTLAVFPVSLPTHGGLLLNTDGSFTYTPNSNYQGVDFFTYQANDGFVNSANVATVTINVVTNAAPIANTDTYSVNKNNVITVSAANGVLKNDVDTDPLTANLVSNPANGVLAFNPDGSFIYQPNTGFNGPTDTFVYRASDGTLNSTPTTVTLSIKTSSTAPTANPNTYSVNANNTLSIPLASGILNNDTDPEGDRLVANLVTGPNQGTLTLNSNGSFTYQPNANFKGIDTFIYKANDGLGNSNPATVTINVGATNNPPVVTVPGSQVVLRNTDLVIASGLSISDVDAGTNAVRATLTAANGSLFLGTTTGVTVTDPDGDKSVVVEGTIANLNAALTNLKYHPDSSFTGSDDINIIVNDLGFTGNTGAQTGTGDIAVNVSTGPGLVRDINQTPNVAGTGTNPSTPANLISAGNVVYFTANDGIEGTELWKSDGTNAGTVMVANINPNSGGSSSPSNLTIVGSTLYFSATDPTSGTELWKTDLINGTTTLVKNINPLTGSSSPSNLVNVNGTLFFRANDGSGLTLWKTDGTAVGTVQVGATVGYSQPGSLTAVGSTLYFTSSNGTQLWKSDGTDAGTVLVKNLGTSAGVTSLTAIGSSLFFTAKDSQGVELWRSDGSSAGTTRISDINSGANSSNPNNLKNLGGTLYFIANNGTSSGLYKSTATGTVSLVQNLPSAGQAPISLTVVGTTLFFVVDAGTSTTPKLQLWKSDGSTTGLVKDINPSGNANPASLTNVNGILLFTANDGSTRIWQSDGTAAGTIPVSAAFTGSAPSNLTGVSSRLFFTADTTAAGTELWAL